MPCDTYRLPGQTITQRKEEIREAIDRLNKELIAGKVKAIVGPQGAVAFQGWNERSRVTDACALRQILSSGSALAKQAIARAEMLAGRKIDKMVIGQGAHSHDGGRTWHNHKG